MQDRISALMDGELETEDAAGLIEQFGNTDGLREQWAVYHLISDILEHSEATHLDVTKRVRARLAAEPAIPAASSEGILPFPHSKAKRKRFAYAAAASLAAVTVVGWMSLQMQAPEQLQQNLAKNESAPATAPATVTAATPVTGPAPIPVSTPVQFNDYLLAHREFSPSTAMHGVAPYMRAVTETHQHLPR